MKNPTQEAKRNILKTIGELLDRRDVEIHFELSAEMRQTTEGDAITVEYEPTGALCAVIAIKSMPAIKWAEDLKAEDEANS